MNMVRGLEAKLTDFSEKKHHAYWSVAMTTSWLSPCLPRAPAHASAQDALQDYPYPYVADKVTAMDHLHLTAKHKKIFFPTPAENIFKVWLRGPQHHEILVAPVPSNRHG